MSGSAQRWVAFDVVAQIYHVEVEWLQRAEDLGVLPTVERRAGAAHLPAEDLDLVAALVRWHRHLGLDLEVVAGLLLERWGR